MKIGIARKIISPPKVIYLIGYGDRLSGNRGIRDELTATALTFDDGNQHVTLVTLDLLAINEQTTEKIQNLTHPNLLLCCAHTHSAPVTYANEKSSRRNRRYLEFLIAQVAEVIKESEGNLQPAQLAWAMGESQIAVNRRERQADGSIEIGVNPEGSVDRSLALLQIQTPAGDPLANVVNLACHNTVFGPKNQLVSADWEGEMRKRVESETGVPCLYIQGATGDLNPKREVGTQDENAVVSLGAEAARDVLSALSRLNPIAGDEIRFHASEVWFPLEAKASTPAPPKTYKSVLAKMAGLPQFVVDPVLNYRYPWKTKIEAREEFWAVPAKVTTLQIGDFSLAGLGMEVFHEIGQKIKADAPSDYAMFSGVCNGCVGYLPTAEEHARGGYEVNIAPYFYRLPGRLSPESEALALEAVRESWV